MKSENINELVAAMAKAQSEIEGAIKDQKNPFYNSTYADLNSVIKACRSALNRHGIVYFQYSEDEGDKYFLVTKLAHLSGQSISGRIPLLLKKNDMQQYGAAMTYAKRYGLQAIVGVNIEEDDDGNSLVEPCKEYKSFMARWSQQPPEAKAQLKKDLAHISEAKKSPGDRNFWAKALDEIVRATT